MDTCLLGADSIHDTIAASYVFEDHVLIDSVQFYHKAATSYVDSFAIYIPNVGTIFADSLTTLGTGGNSGPSGSFASATRTINRTFTVGQEIAFKWIIQHTTAGNYLQMKRITLFGKRYYD